MGSTSRFLIRWFSYPAIFGGVSAGMVWLLYQGIPYWPSTAILAALGVGCGLHQRVPGGGPALVDLIVEHTHTCYLGDREHRQAWGYGCGSCPACELRAKGWAGYIGAA